MASSGFILMRDEGLIAVVGDGSARGVSRRKAFYIDGEKDFGRLCQRMGARCPEDTARGLA